MAHQDGRHSLRNVRSLPHDADVKGDIVRQIIYPPKLVVRALIFLELRKGEGSGIPPPLPIEEDQKKPDLNEVKPISFARFDNKSMNRPPSPAPNKISIEFFRNKLLSPAASSCVLFPFDTRLVKIGCYGYEI